MGSLQSSICASAKPLSQKPQATAVAPVEDALTPQALQLMRPSQQQRQASQQQEAAQREPSQMHLSQGLRLTGARDSGRTLSGSRGDGLAPQSDDGELPTTRSTAAGCLSAHN